LYGTAYLRRSILSGAPPQRGGRVASEMRKTKATKRGQGGIAVFDQYGGRDVGVVANYQGYRGCERKRVRTEMSRRGIGTKGVFKKTRSALAWKHGGG